MPKISRLQTPPQFSAYRLYKSFLRIDFRWRCCYCGVRERTWGGSTHFAVEHFKPKSIFPELETVYSNLYYACDGCNSSKWRHWPSAIDIAAGRRFFDACSDFSKDHFRLDVSGKLNHLSNCGEYTIKMVRLNRSILVKIRSQHLERLRDYKSALRALSDLKSRLPSCSDMEKKRLIESAVASYELVLKQVQSHLFSAPFD